MAKRIAIISTLLIVALLAGLLGAELLGGPFASRNYRDSRAATERYALGRDVYRQEDYAVDTRYAPYRPGEKRIASPTVSGARKIEPYEAARPEHRIRFDSVDGNFMDATGAAASDYAFIDPPAQPKPKAKPATPEKGTEGPQNLLPGYIRTERPRNAAPVAEPEPVRVQPDPVAETERRIMDIAGRKKAASAGGTTSGQASTEPALPSDGG